MRKQRLAHDQDPRPAIIQDVLILGGLEHGADRDRDRSDLDGAEEAVSKLRCVWQQKGHTLLRAYAEILEHAAHAVDPLQKLTVGHRLVAAFKRDLLPPAALHILVNKVRGDVKARRQVNCFHIPHCSAGSSENRVFNYM